MYNRFFSNCGDGARFHKCRPRHQARSFGLAKKQATAPASRGELFAKTWFRSAKRRRNDTSMNQAWTGLLQRVMRPTHTDSFFYREKVRVGDRVSQSPDPDWVLVVSLRRRFSAPSARNPKSPPGAARARRAACGCAAVNSLMGTFCKNVVSVRKATTQRHVDGRGLDWLVAARDEGHPH